MYQNKAAMAAELRELDILGGTEFRLRKPFGFNAALAAPRLWRGRKRLYYSTFLP
jgi:hypothetical protein